MRCPIQPSTSTIRTRKSSKARGACSTRRGFPTSPSRKSWRTPASRTGGFYRHFSKKDELYAEAVRRFLCDDAPKPWRPAPPRQAPGRKSRGQRVLDAYFSQDHFDDHETCCPLIALPSDVMRGSNTVKGAYREVLKKLIDIFFDDLDQPLRRERALALATLSIGGVVAAKCVDDPALADDLRRAAHRQALRIGGWMAAASEREPKMAQT